LRLGQSGEFGLLAELERRGLVRGLDAEGPVLAGGVVLTQDLLVEGVHFRLDWTSFRDLGYKAAAVNLSDLAAMGGDPDALLVGLALPAETELDDVIELYEGLAEPGVPVAGGDTTASPSLVLSVAAVGRSERVPGRAGAKPGDVLVVTGPLGGSAAGFHALREGLGGFDELVERHRRPPLRLDEGRRLGRVAHALVDLSDGIAGDAARIAERSGCRIVLEAEQIPRAAGINEVADLPFWTMGEDYELLAALAADDADELGLPVVGRCEEGSGVEVLLGGRPLDVSGWDSLRG
jgi:thiamine-monophosphate kinase